ncbi:MAG: zinc-binding dehydrogenase, partial [Candidatus Thermoplasmatota archaeon]
GADLVVDLVSTADTMRRGVAALAPGGKLVEVAPGEESLAVSPALLMDREISIVGSLSSTMADLARAIALAEAGLLKPVVTRTASLAEAAAVLGDLEQGRIVGRAVLLP